MADVFCNNCGHRNLAGSNFCSSCGQPLDRGLDEDPKTITFTLEPSTGQTDELHVDPTAMPGGGVLIVTRGPNSGSEYALDGGVTTIGRHPDSDVFLDDVTVSRRHVEVEGTDDGYRIHDVGSLNGTYVNQQLLEGDRILANGDELQVGRFKLVFVAGTEG